MAKIEYKGHTFEYDPKFTHSYKTMKALSTAVENPGRLFNALDNIFLDRADEYAELLDDDVNEIIGLVNAIAEKDTDAKN